MEKLSIFVETHGCQMNEYDSDRIINSLSAHPVKNPADADVVIVNTCAIRDKADHKAVSAIGRYKKYKISNPNLIIGMAGCVAQLYGKKLIKQIPHLDFVIGPREIGKLKELIKDIKDSSKFKKINTSMDIEEIFKVSPYHEEGKINGWYKPLEVVKWLRDHLLSSGIRLKAGDILSLGNIGIIRQLHPDSPRGPAYQSNSFTLSYYGLSDQPVNVTIMIDRS